MRLIVSNAFSLSMLDREAQKGTPPGYIPVSQDAMATARLPRPITYPRDFVAQYDDIVSIVGHADTARLLSNILGIDLPANRVSIKLGSDDVLLVGQYIGPRLPEGATTIPEGSSIEWWAI